MPSLRLTRTALAFFVTSTLLGTMLLGLIGIPHHLHPQSQAGRLAHMQDWFHAVGHVEFMGASTWRLAVGRPPEDLVALIASGVLLAVLVMAFHVTFNLRLSTPRCGR